MKLFISNCLLIVSSILSAEANIITLRFNPCDGMTRSDISYLSFDFEPVGILVLCLGYNSDAKHLLENETWIDFSKKNKLILIALSFASKMEDLKNGNGYYYASKGSGKILLQAIEKAYKRKVPIYIYGFSGGAHFASRFVEWAPNRVGAWCAYSAGWWDSISYKKDKLPIGIVACGDKDERFDASISYFKNGRMNDRQWTWIALKNTNHALSRKLDDFVKIYFEAIINDDLDPCWVNNTTAKTKKIINGNKDSNYSYLPSSKLLSEWRNLSYGE